MKVRPSEDSIIQAVGLLSTGNHRISSMETNQFCIILLTVYNVACDSSSVCNLKWSKVIKNIYSYKWSSKYIFLWRNKFIYIRKVHRSQVNLVSSDTTDVKNIKTNKGQNINSITITIIFVANLVTSGTFVL